MERTMRFLAGIVIIGTALVVTAAAARPPADAWSRGATPCPFLDTRADPAYTMDLALVLPARISLQRKDWSALEFNVHSEFLYFRGLLYGDLDWRLDMRSTLPLDSGGLALPDHLLALSMPLLWTWRYVNDTAFRVTLAPGLYSELPSLGSDALSMPVGLLFIRTLDPTLTALAGVTVRPRFERLVMPTAGVIWQPTGAVRLEATVPSGRLMVHFSPTWAGDVHWDWMSTTYLLPDDKQNRRNVTFEESRFGVGLTHTISPEFRIRGGLGLIGGRSIGYHHEGDTGIDNTLFVSIGAGGAF